MEIQVMITEPFWKISKKLLKLKKRLDLKLNSSNAKLFPGWYNWKTTIESFSIFPKTLRRYQNTREKWTYHEHIILGSPLGTKSQADLLERKIKELEKVNGVVETLDSHYGFLCWKIASVWQTCCTSWESVNVLIIHGKLCQNRTRRVLMCVMWTSKVCNVNFDVISSTQLALPAGMGGLGVSSASILALPAFLASAFGASDFLSTIY